MTTAKEAHVQRLVKQIDHDISELVELVGQLHELTYEDGGPGLTINISLVLDRLVKSGRTMIYVQHNVGLIPDDDFYATLSEYEALNM